MKTIYITLFFALVGANLFSQNCIPDPKYTKPALYPDSATGFAVGVAGQPYSQLMTVIVPKDTLLFGFPVPFDSIVMKNLTGMPTGFSYACEPKKCSWKGNSTGCILISGNPTELEVGTYPLKFSGSGYIGGSKIAQPINVNYYTIKIVSALGVSELDMNRFDVSQNYPNPFNAKTLFRFSMPQPADVVMNVYNVLGKLVLTNKIKAVKGLNDIYFDREVFTSGIYTYSFSYGDAVIAKRMLIE